MLRLLDYLAVFAVLASLLFRTEAARVPIQKHHEEEYTVFSALESLGQLLFPSSSTTRPANAAAEEKEPVDIERGRPLCDPILHHVGDYRRASQQHCMFPLPNDFYLRETADTPTGYQVEIPRMALPRTRFFARFNPHDWNKRDGWGASSFISVTGLSENVLMEWANINATDDGFFTAPDHPRASADTPARGQTRFRRENKQSPDIFSFASHAYIARSTEKESPTLLIDAETGERIPHWVSLDMSWAAKYLTSYGPLSHQNDSAQEQAESDMRANPTPKFPKNKRWISQTLMIQPARRLKSQRRYVVALRNLRSKTRRNDQGEPELIQAPLGFRVLRDDLATSDAALLERKQHFRDRRIFETLDPHLLRDRSELVLAWDFSTASAEGTTEHLRWMREDAFRRLEGLNYSYTVNKVTDDYSENIFRRVDGTIRAPLYLGTEKASMRSRLVFNPKASSYLERMRPVFQKYTDVPFTLWIPRIAVEKGHASLLQYGHGLFQSREEGNLPWMQRMANSHNYAVITGDWWGLQSSDINTIGKILIANIGGFAVVPERSAQGVLNQLMIMRVFRYSQQMLTDANMFYIRNRTVVETAEAAKGGLEIKNRLYYGCSLGGILGTVYLSLTPDVKVATLNVPGGPFSLLFPRNSFGSLILSKLVAVHFPNTADRIAILFLMHHLWELCDPSGYSDAVEQGGIWSAEPGRIDTSSAGMGKKKILIQIGISDTNVNGIAAGYLIRSFGAQTFRGNAYERSFTLRQGIAVRQGIDRKSDDTVDPFTGFQFISDRKETPAPNIVVTSFGFRPSTESVVPFFNFPSPVTKMIYDTHELVRLQPLANRQVTDFFQVYLDMQKQGTMNDDKLWVRDICGQTGCWDLPRPHRRFW